MKNPEGKKKGIKRKDIREKKLISLVFVAALLRTHTHSWP